MTKKRKELDVDFIGGLEPLTKEEEKLISDVIENRKKARSAKAKRTDGKKVNA
ncbi:MAG: hypothetical protein ACMVP2_08230 [Imperialibacter sp.]|uniref:hypothetical protein n=1 Tax=Imperialibacter sp. TaxID=2038411 RepID=UPI0030DC4342|tara:strand:+ start:1026 stop:1184 length:159 start_codon:yes stop_codon:yes gene_type:complete